MDKNINLEGGKCCNTKYASAGILAVGLFLAGFFPGYFYYQSKMNTNFVNVKGLAEMNVKADLAVWDLKFVVTNDNLQPAQNEVARQLKQIVAFLKDQGFSDNEIMQGRLETNDLMTNPYRDRNFASRYILSQNVKVRSANVDLVAKALNASGELVAKGIVFDSQNYGSPVSYIFTKLNEIKPQMLEEATKNAQAAAAEFAKSSNSRVGGIHRANQGVFSILPREQTANAQEMNQIDKMVRVVSTIEYYLD